MRVSTSATRVKRKHRRRLSQDQLSPADGVDEEGLERSALALARGGVDGEIHPADEERDDDEVGRHREHPRALALRGGDVDASRWRGRPPPAGRPRATGAGAGLSGARSRRGEPGPAGSTRAPRCATDRRRAAPRRDGPRGTGSRTPRGSTSTSMVSPLRTAASGSRGAGWISTRFCSRNETRLGAFSLPSTGSFSGSSASFESRPMARTMSRMRPGPRKG